MASYVLTTDALVTLNGTIPFNSVSIPCNKGNVVPLVAGVLNLNGNTPNRFARYKVTLQGNIQIPTDGAVTPIALGIFFLSIRFTNKCQPSTFCISSRNRYWKSP